MSEQINLVNEWINKADHDLGAAKLKEEIESAIDISQEFRSFALSIIGDIFQPE